MGVAKKLNGMYSRQELARKHHLALESDNRPEFTTSWAIRGRDCPWPAVIGSALFFNLYRPQHVRSGLQRYCGGPSHITGYVTVYTGKEGRGHGLILFASPFRVARAMIPLSTLLT